MRKSLPKISILAAMNMLATSWDMVTKTTIVNCFAKAGLSADTQGQALQDEDDPFKDLEKEIEKLQGKDQEVAPLSANAKDFLNVDEGIMATETLQTEEEILAELRGEELKDSQDDDIECDELTSKPTADGIRNAMEVVFNYCIFSEQGDTLCHQYLKLNEMIEMELVQNRKQMTLDSYFAT